MQRVPDPYRVLDVGRDATSAEIRAAHRRLAKRFHPDATAADEPAFLAVQGAYELLKDPVRRAEWDRKHAPGPVRADERSAARPGTTSRQRTARARPDPARWTWSAAGIPWWEDGGSPGTKRQPGRKRPTAPRPPDVPPPASPSGREPARPVDTGPDPDVFSRSSGAAWSSAARAFFRRASDEMPSGAANPDTPHWTTPLGTTSPPRYGAAPTPRPSPRAGPRPTQSAPSPMPIVRHRPRPPWPTGVQRIESALMAALPFALVAGFGVVGRLGPRSAGIVALGALVVAALGFYGKPRAAWLATRGALGGVMGYLAYLGASLVLPLGASVLTSFILAILSIGAAYAAGVALALRDVPVRRPWLPPPGSPD